MENTDIMKNYKINIDRKDLYSKDYKSAKISNYKNINKFNISQSLVDIFSILIKEER